MGRAAKRTERWDGRVMCTGGKEGAAREEKEINPLAMMHIKQAREFYQCRRPACANEQAALRGARSSMTRGAAEGRGELGSNLNDTMGPTVRKSSSSCSSVAVYGMLPTNTDRAALLPREPMSCQRGILFRAREGRGFRFRLFMHLTSHVPAGSEIRVTRAL